MADQFVDKNLGNDGNAGTSWGTGNAVATIAQAITNASAGDKVYIRSYGPDDPYTITAELVPNGEELIGCVGADTGTTPGQYVLVWIVSSTADVDIFDSANAAIYRYICASSTGTPSGATNRGWNLDGTTSVTLDHCRSEGCTEAGFYSDKTAGVVTVSDCEAWDDGSGWEFHGAGCYPVITGFASYSSGDYGITLGATLSTARATLRGALIVEATTAPVYLGAVADLATGSPDFNGYDTASGAATYANAQPSPVPANDIYSITVDDWLPLRAQGILRCPIEYPGKAQGYPAKNRRKDIGIDGEYLLYVTSSWTGYEIDGVSLGGASGVDWFSHDGANDIRAQLKFYAGGLSGPADTIRQAWVYLTCKNILVSGTVDIVTYDDGYTYDPEQDTIAQRHSRSASGSILTETASFGSLGAHSHFFRDPTIIAGILGRGRRISIALINGGVTGDQATIASYDASFMAERPMLILIYSPPKQDYRGGEAGYLATQIRGLATMLAGSLS